MIKKYGPSSRADIAKLYSIVETAGVTGLFATLTVANIVVVCPAAIGAGGPAGAAGCALGTAASLAATVGSGAALVKEVKAYIRDKRHRRR